MVNSKTSKSWTGKCVYIKKYMSKSILIITKREKNNLIQLLN